MKLKLKKLILNFFPKVNKKKRQIKRTEITQVIFKTNEIFYRKQINKNIGV